jgi:hypothetical protein
VKRHLPDPELALEARNDVAYARYLRDNPRLFPIFVGTPFTTLVDAVRRGRVEAEAERRSFRYPEVAPPPNYWRYR